MPRFVYKFFYSFTNTTSEQTKDPRVSHCCHALRRYKVTARHIRMFYVPLHEMALSMMYCTQLRHCSICITEERVLNNMVYGRTIIRDDPFCTKYHMR